MSAVIEHDWRGECEEPRLRAFRVVIGPRGYPRLSFDAIGLDSVSVAAEWQAECREFERVEVRAK